MTNTPKHDHALDPFSTAGEPLITSFLAGTPEWVVSRRLGHAHVQTTLDLTAGPRGRGAARGDELGLLCQRLADGPVTRGRRSQHLHPAGDGDPIWRLWEALPPQWRGPVLGEGISDWALITENDWARLDLSGLPDPYAAELAWMAHWQACDGTRVSVLAMAQLAHIVRHAAREGPAGCRHRSVGVRSRQSRRSAPGPRHRPLATRHRHPRRQLVRPGQPHPQPA